MKRLFASRRLLESTVFLLHQIGQLSHKTRLDRKCSPPKSVVHISPHYFANSSLIGGGERYASALAEAMANYIDTTLISFGANRKSYKQNNLKVEIYPTVRAASNPISYSFLEKFLTADVIHCHHYRKDVISLAIAAGSALNKKIFLTDHGGTGSRIADHLSLCDLVNGLLLVSAFSAKSLPSVKWSKVIYGGVSEDFIQVMQQTNKNKVLFVGRLLPHKGVNYLIEAIDEHIELDIIGRVYDEDYFALLQNLAKGKKVRFITSANDDEIIEAYSRAIVTVMPSVYVDINSIQHPVSELLGLVLLESMACGTPVICTDVGGMPEIVKEGVTGFIVPPNDSRALRERINCLVEDVNKAQCMGQQAHKLVLEEFTWDAVAKKCLEAYTQAR